MAISALIKTVEITSFGVDDTRAELYYGYIGKDADGDEIVRSAISRTGEDTPASLAKIDAVINATAQAQANAGQPIAINTYAIIKAALETAVAEELGIEV